MRANPSSQDVDYQQRDGDGVVNHPLGDKNDGSEGCDWESDELLVGKRPVKIKAICQDQDKDNESCGSSAHDPQIAADDNPCDNSYQVIFPGDLLMNVELFYCLFEPDNDGEENHHDANPLEQPFFRDCFEKIGS